MFYTDLFTTKQTKEKSNEPLCSEYWGATYSTGDLDLIDFLKRTSVEENQLPVSFIFLHRGPCDKKLIIWAKTAVGPGGKNSIHVFIILVRVVHNDAYRLQLPWKLKVLHREVVGQSGSFIYRLPKAAYIPNLQRVIP